MNIRTPRPVSREFLWIQDGYLQEELVKKGVTDGESLQPSRLDRRLFLWKGDIATLKIDAIANAANIGMTGCYVPCRGCIDNAIPYSITQSCMQSRMAYG